MGFVNNSKIKSRLDTSFAVRGTELRNDTLFDNNFDSYPYRTHPPDRNADQADVQQAHHHPASW
jgi:hypothetical protein